MTEIIQRKRAYNHVCTWYVMTQSKWKYFIYFFVCSNNDDLKFNTFLGGMNNKTYNHAENQLTKKRAEDELFF